MKEHESKYEPLGHDETFKIMEEILAMQIGLNTTGVSISTFTLSYTFLKIHDNFADGGGQ